MQGVEQKALARRTGTVELEGEDHVSLVHIQIVLIANDSPKGMWLKLWLRLSLSCDHGPIVLDPRCLVLGKMLRDAAMDWDGPELEGGEKKGEGEKEEKEGEGDIHVANWRHCLSKIFSILQVVLPGCREALVCPFAQCLMPMPASAPAPGCCCSLPPSTLLCRLCPLLSIYLSTHLLAPLGRHPSPALLPCVST